jgi:DNA primase
VPAWGDGDQIVVTEDILSAFKVGLVGQAACALGTSPTPALVRYLLSSRKPVSVWLDPDAAGRRGASKLVKSLRAYGLEPTNILSARDPKLHTLEQIKEILE